ncbi:MAG: prepilin-type N-terminal cleavage/methylation domain-containing protein [Sedimentisphaerales bacterium]|nr:prepilin-type N-terminal cleavage/methylation domain-containing protein [Sedimentisphaerales bacterium]
MKSRKGFTLIELMVVIVIVAVLAAIVVPLLISRIERAKRSEGKAIAGQIATAVRAYAAEYEGDATFSATPDLEDDLGFRLNELDGKYFQQSGTTVTGVDVTDEGQVSYEITVNSKVADLDDVVLTCDADNGYSPTFDEDE